MNWAESTAFIVSVICFTYFGIRWIEAYFGKQMWEKERQYRQNEHKETPKK